MTERQILATWRAGYPAPIEGKPILPVQPVAVEIVEVTT